MAFVLLFLNFPTEVYSNVGISISGKVIDAFGLPVQGAFISSTPGGTTAVTDWQGSFELTGLPEGIYTLAVSHIGYEQTAENIVRITKSGNPHVIITLKPKPITLAEAHITMPVIGRRASNLHEVIIERRDWELTGARDIQDALRQSASVTVLEGAGTVKISFRGSPSRAVEILRDGVPLQNAATGEADLSTIKLQDLDKIIINQTGTGGKIQLVSRDLSKALSNDYPKMRSSAEVYTPSGFRLDGTYRGSRGRVSGELGIGSAIDRGNFRYRLNDGSVHQRINNESQTVSIFGRINRRADKINVNSAFYVDNFSRGVPNLIYDTPTPEASTKNESYTLTLGTRFSLGSDFIESLVYSRYYNGIYENPEFQIHPETGQTLHFQPEQTSQTGRKTGISAEYKTRFFNLEPRINWRAYYDEYIGRDLINDEVRVGVGFGSAKRTTYELESDVRFRKPVREWTSTLSTGMTGSSVNDQDGRSFDNLLPRLSAAIDRSFGDYSATISLSWGRSVIIPSFNALLTTENLYTVGNRNLRPEKGESIESTAEIRLENHPVSCRISITPFQRRIEDLIVWQRNAFLKYYPDNVSQSYSRGLEANASLSALDNQISLICHYIYNKSTNETPEDINAGNFTPLNPLHSGIASLCWIFRNWSVNLDGQWVDRRYSTMANYDPISTAGMGLPPYSLYNVSVSRKLLPYGNVLRVSVGIDNLFDTEYRFIERSPMPGRIYFTRIVFEIK